MRRTRDLENRMHGGRNGPRRPPMNAFVSPISIAQCEKNGWFAGDRPTGAAAGMRSPENPLRKSKQRCCPLTNFSGRSNPANWLLQGRSEYVAGPAPQVHDLASVSANLLSVSWNGSWPLLVKV